MNAETLINLSKADKTLGALIKKVGPMTLKPKLNRSPYEALVESVIYQQLAGKAAAAILTRFKGLYLENKMPSPTELLNTTTETLRSAGLSRNKILALQDIAEKTVDGTVPEQQLITNMTDAEIIERLTVIRGVGPWTVEMFLIATLGRPDVLPVTDYGVRKGFALTYGLNELPTPKELLVFGKKWQPYRTTAAWYLWRALELK